MFDKYTVRFDAWVGSSDCDQDVGRWRVLEPALCDVDFGSLRGAYAHSAHDDASLGALIRLAQRGEENAFLSLLIIFVPRLVSWRPRLQPMVQNLDHFEATSPPLTGLCVSSLGQAVAVYPTLNRSRHVFANLTLDVRYILTYENRQRAWRRYTVEVMDTTSSDVSEPMWTTGEASDLDLVDLLQVYARRSTSFEPDRLASMAYRVWVVGEDRCTVAADEGLAYETLKKRLQKFRGFLASVDELVGELAVA